MLVMATPHSFTQQLVALEPLDYRPEAAAVVADVSLATIARAIATGELQAVRIGRKVRIPRSALEAYWRTRAMPMEPSATTPLPQKQA